MMVECEARGIQFLPKDGGMVIRLPNPASLRAEDVLKEQVSEIEGRWDGK
jgi:hypothetical protein